MENVPPLRSVGKDVNRSNVGIIDPEGVKRSRKSKPWDDKAYETKRKEISELADRFASIPREKLLCAVAKCMKDSGEKALCQILRYCAADASLSDDILKRIETKIDDVKQISPQKALSMLLDSNLSKQGYITVGKAVNSCGKHILPCYDRVREAKSECAPSLSTICVTDVSASADLNELLMHTASRIVQLQKRVLVQEHAKYLNNVLTLEVSWGMDGSSGFSNYKQGYSNSDTVANQDSSFFAIAINPLRMHWNGNIYWNNKTPQSYRFCRPLKIMFAKETTQLVLEQHKWVQDQIETLPVFTVNLRDNMRVQVRFKMHLTIIDGKVLSILKGTSCQTCPICGCNPVQFNVLENLTNGTFTPKPDSLIHGLSVLHSYIRVMEYLLKVAYRLDFKKWQAKVEYQDLFKSQKSRIQKELWTDLKLRVDYPNPGGSGSSNDGNTARRAFQNYQTFARILNINVDIVQGFRTILVAMASQFEINPCRFKIYCLQLHSKIMKEYDWYRLPSSVHKLLVHGSEIIENSGLPVGVLAEDCAESRNKFYKFDRTHRARKTSRQDTMRDVFCRGLHTSDPIISSLSMRSRANIRKRNPLPESVVKLLDDPPIMIAGDPNSENGDVEDDSESDDSELILENESKD